MSSIHTVSAQYGAHPIIIETGKLAKLADGAVTVRYGDTFIIVTAVSATKIKEGQDFFPLTVEYRERAAAVGKIPGGYFKREGRPSEKEILTCRMTDRPLRPLFPKGYLYDTQIITTLLSADGENDPDILSMNGASAALMVSDIPFGGPIGAVRVGRIDGKFVSQPTHAQMDLSDLDLVYVGSESEILMIEGSALEMPEADFKAALAYAQKEAQVVIGLQKDLASRVNKAKRKLPLYAVKPELVELAYSMVSDRIEGAIYRPSKVERYGAVGALKDEVAVAIKAKYPEATSFDISSRSVRPGPDQGLPHRHPRQATAQRRPRRGNRSSRALRRSRSPAPFARLLALRARRKPRRFAWRDPRPPATKPRTSTVTPAAKPPRRFILHYNFLPFSVGETGRVGGLNRREIGHGALAERSLVAVIPSENDFPYAIRVSSEVMESNGSTSMASVCGGCLALMDAGVPIKTPVAGISVGLVTEHDDNDKLKGYLLLADILGSEDHYGDMDFKLCGTGRTGVTGFQLDLKLGGIPLSLMNEAIDQAKTTRTAILSFMETVINSPRTELSPFAPRIETIQINPEKIGLVIGPGGKNIKSIVAETGAEINIEDDGRVKIYSSNGDAMERAKEIILGMVGDIEIGKIYRGRVVTLKDFGAFVEVLPGKDGLVHISEWSDQRVNRMDDVAKVGDEVWVKCIGQDDKGRSKLSRKVAMKERAASGLEPAAAKA